MSEPRMRARPKGAQFAPTDLEAMLTAFGDEWKPLPETVRVLDEIVTDFIIETSHLAAITPILANRSKIKIDDFKFALRKDPKKLGRVTELLHMDKDIKKKRRAFDVEEGLPVGGTGPGKGRGRRKKKAEGEGEGDALVDLARDDKFSKNPNRKRRHTEEPSSDLD